MVSARMRRRQDHELGAAESAAVKHCVQERADGCTCDDEDDPPATRSIAVSLLSLVIAAAAFASLKAPCCMRSGLVPAAPIVQPRSSRAVSNARRQRAAVKLFVAAGRRPSDSGGGDADGLMRSCDSDEEA